MLLSQVSNVQLVRRAGSGGAVAHISLESTDSDALTCTFSELARTACLARGIWPAQGSMRPKYHNSEDQSITSLVVPILVSCGWIFVSEGDHSVSSHYSTPTRLGSAP